MCDNFNSEAKHHEFKNHSFWFVSTIRVYYERKDTD